MTYLPNNLNHITSLRELFCGHNKLTFLPPFNHLHVLDCSFNQLTMLSEIPQLRILRCDVNPLVYVPLSLHSLLDEGTLNQIQSNKDLLRYRYWDMIGKDIEKGKIRRIPPEMSEIVFSIKERVPIKIILEILREYAEEEEEGWMSQLMNWLRLQT